MSESTESAGASSEQLVVNDEIVIPYSEFRWKFTRSSGPGGQNVNKVNTRAQLAWPVKESPSLPDAVRQRFERKYGRRISIDGELIVSSQRFRRQEKNRQDCLDKLAEMLASVAQPPKRRKPTRPSAGSRKRRLENKRQRSQRKQLRQKPDRDS